MGLSPPCEDRYADGSERSDLTAWWHGCRGEGFGLLSGEESGFAVGLDGACSRAVTWASRSSIVVAVMVMRPV